jgi:hypothetical protein
VRINKANKLRSERKGNKKMPKYGSYLQLDASRLFKKQDIDMKKWANCSFETALDEKNEMYIMGKEVVVEMKEIKKTLEDMVEEWEEYEEDNGETYMIFDMSEYVIGDYTKEQDRTWVYEYEIDEYYDLITGKLGEYYSLEKDMEKEKMKIQMEKYVCAGVALALLRR